MHLKGLVDEDFVNYKEPSLFLITSTCDWKCCREQNLPLSVCQNMPIIRDTTKDISEEKIYERYIDNPITKSIVLGGLEPFDQFGEVYNLIYYFRAIKGNTDTFVIYTGYYPSEIDEMIKMLSMFDNIIVKFGRYIPNSKKIFDKILGVELASENQFALKIS